MKNFFLRMNGLKYIAAFCITVVLAVAFLAAGAFLPQEPIQENILESIDTVTMDMENHYILDRGKASMLDLATDVMILQESLTTRSSYLGSILTNPVYAYEGLAEWEDMDETLARLAYEMPHDSVWYYAKYWLGFRTLMRLALVFFNYSQIKRYLAVIFFILFAAAMCSVAKNANAKLAFLFAVSIILVRPHIIATSMQYTCCFLIAFIAMLLVPWIHGNSRYAGLFFMEVGMITMYFDFYTVPLITFGFPALYLYVLRMEEGESTSLKVLIRDFVTWLAGYGFMWIANLILTSTLTSVNAWQQGWTSFASRTGIRKEAHLVQYHSLEAAFDALQETMFFDDEGKVVYLLCVGIILMIALIKTLRGHTSMSRVRSSFPYLFVAVMPILWFCITMQPIAIHAFFQYRTIAVTYWAVGVYLYYLFPEKNSLKELSA